MAPRKQKPSCVSINEERIRRCVVPGDRQQTPGASGTGSARPSIAFEEQAPYVGVMEGTLENVVTND
jgi:hypothetical protein